MPLTNVWCEQRGCRQEELYPRPTLPRVGYRARRRLHCPQRNQERELVRVPILGMSLLSWFSSLRENVGALDVALTEDDIKELDEIVNTFKAVGDR